MFMHVSHHGVKILHSHYIFRHIHLMSYCILSLFSCNIDQYLDTTLTIMLFTNYRTFLTQIFENKSDASHLKRNTFPEKKEPRTDVNIYITSQVHCHLSLPFQSSRQIVFYWCLDLSHFIFSISSQNFTFLHVG